MANKRKPCPESAAPEKKVIIRPLEKILPSLSYALSRGFSSFFDLMCRPCFALVPFLKITLAKKAMRTYWNGAMY